MSSAQNLSINVAVFGLAMMAALCKAQGKSDFMLNSASTGISLNKENVSLKKALIESNKAEKYSKDKLVQIEARLEALGLNLLDGNDDRLLQAVTDFQLLNEKHTTLLDLSTQLLSVVRGYTSASVSTEPNARLVLEKAIRELDTFQTSSNKPRPEIRLGDLNRSNVVSLDPISGLLVLNIGENNGATIGMFFTLSRGQKVYAKAVIADVRSNVSGAFIERLESTEYEPRLGDIASLITQN